MGRSCLLRIASCQTNRLFILLERAEKEIRFSIANSMFKPKMDIDRHGPRLMPNNCKNLNPPYFSLPFTFKCSEPLSSTTENHAQKIHTVAGEIQGGSDISGTLSKLPCCIKNYFFEKFFCPKPSQLCAEA